MYLPKYCMYLNSYLGPPVRYRAILSLPAEARPWHSLAHAPHVHAYMPTQVQEEPSYAAPMAMYPRPL
jgi:hypothetical protein